MNAVDWTALVTQIPLVVAFIWYSNNQQKIFLDALTTRDKLYEDRNKALVEAIEAQTTQLAKVTELMCSHDSWTRESVALMVRNARSRGSEANPNP